MSRTDGFSRRRFLGRSMTLGAAAAAPYFVPSHVGS